MARMSQPFGIIAYGVQEAQTRTESVINMHPFHSSILLPIFYCRNDKLILKVTEDSDVALMLAGLMPDYISLNHIEGQIEYEPFFPVGYRNTEEKEEEEEDGVDANYDKVRNGVDIETDG